MNAAKIIKLNEKDKKVLALNTDICTESHGKGCNIRKESSKAN